MGVKASLVMGSGSGDDRVLKLLNSQEWQQLSGSRAHGVRRKLELIEASGVPPMRVLPASALSTPEGVMLPRSDTALTVDAREALENRGVILFCSHRWLRPEHGLPDDAHHTKARALDRFARWYEAKYQARRVYFWVDWACIDQEAPLEGVKALPLYVAASNDILCYETTDYDSRAWCQVERLVAYKFMATGRIPWVMRHSDPHVISGAVSAKSVRMHTEQRKLVDPATCSLSNPATDRAAVEQLRWCALRAKAWTGGDPRDLDFGVTAVDATVVTLL